MTDGGRAGRAWACKRPPRKAGRKEGGKKGGTERKPEAKGKLLACNSIYSSATSSQNNFTVNTVSTMIARRLIH